MNCPTLLTRTRYVDGALPRDDAAAFERHVDSCPACLTSVDRLRAENQALRSALSTIEAGIRIPEFVHQPPVSPLLTGLGWSVLGVCLVNVASMGRSLIPALPRWLDWLVPDAASIGFDLTIGMLITLVNGGGDLIQSVMAIAAPAALAAITLIGIGLLSRRVHHPTVSLGMCLCTALLLVTMTPPVHAYELRRDEHRVTITADEVIDDSLVVSAEDVVIDGTVTGDLIALGEQVTIRGRVGGSLIAVAETLSIEGEVDGNVLGIGETVDFRGAPLAANLYGIGRKVTIHADTRVAGNAVLAAAEADAQGSVGRDLLTATQHLTLSGTLNGDLRAYAEQADLAASARVGGDFTGKVKGAENLRIADGATVTGSTSVENWPEEPSRYLTFEYYLGETLQFLAAFVTGLVLFHFVPALRATRLQGGNEVLVTLGIGAAALIATPVLALAATLTLIGAPLGILGFVLWVAALYAAFIVASGHLGRLLMRGEDDGQVVPLLLGLVIVFVLVNVPLLGGAVRLIAIVTGLGLITRWLHSLWIQRNPA